MSRVGVVAVCAAIAATAALCVTLAIHLSWSLSVHLSDHPSGARQSELHRTGLQIRQIQQILSGSPLVPTLPRCEELGDRARLNGTPGVPRRGTADWTYAMQVCAGQTP